MKKTRRLLRKMPELQGVQDCQDGPHCLHNLVKDLCKLEIFTEVIHILHPAKDSVLLTQVLAGYNKCTNNHYPFQSFGGLDKEA